VGVIILLIASLAAIVVWWLSKQRLMAKPWLEEGALGEFPGSGASALPASKIGLGVLVAVIASLFALFVSAYFMRMQLADWRPVPKPTLLWINTGVLILSSAGLQWAQDAADRREIDGVKTGIFAAALAALAFLAGQLFAWQQLSSLGYFVATSPASSFFYLITAVHALHLLGGLVALGRTV
jgi:cytochrome c oxidase subunit 3